ncbi:unnamed protein product, partial [Scytosiphon promiscuus]
PVGAAGVVGRTRDRAAGVAVTPATVTRSDLIAAAPLPFAGRCEATVGTASRIVDINVSSWLPPPLSSGRPAAWQEWRCSSPGCTNPAYFERRQHHPTPAAKRRRGVDGAGEGPSPAAVVEGRGSVRNSSSTSRGVDGDDTSRGIEVGATEMWCAAHQPEGSELSWSNICSFPGCRLMWGWGCGAATGSIGTVDNDGNPTRLCTRHKKDG